MKDIVTWSLDDQRVRAAIRDADAGKRRSLWTPSKSGLLTALESLITPRLNAGKRAHTFTISEIVDVARLTEKQARIAVSLAKQLRILIPVAGAKFNPESGGTAPGRYMANFAFWEETVPRTVSDLRLALIRSGAYGEDWAKASLAVDRQLESFRVVLEARGHNVLTVKRVIELLVEVDGKQWARVVRRARYWSNWEEIV